MPRKEPPRKAAPPSWDSRIIIALGDLADALPEKPTWRWFVGCAVFGFVMYAAGHWAWTLLK